MIMAQDKEINGSTKKKMNLPGFEIDPVTGKFIPVAVDFSALFSEKWKKRPKADWSSQKKCNDVQSGLATKYRKLENGVRKELFKQTTKSDPISKETTRYLKNRVTGGRKNLLESLPTNDDPWSVSKKSDNPKPTAGKSVLKETNEEKKHGYPFKLPRTPQITFSTIEEEIKTPDSFLGLEKLCQSPMNTDESPVSSVCNLFGSRMIINSEKKTAETQNMSHKDIIRELKKTVAKNQELYKESSMKIKEVLELQEQHESNLKRMVELMDKLEDGESEENITHVNTDEDQENTASSSIKRRSLRLQNKTPSKKTAPISPVILKAGDLRKSTLTKSLVSKCQKYQIDSPRIKKAIDMYNSSRSDCRALLTPKLSRNVVAVSPNCSTWRNSLSLKIQEQCLMLQDTPAHK